MSAAGCETNRLAGLDGEGRPQGEERSDESTAGESRRSRGQPVGAGAFGYFWRQAACCAEQPQADPQGERQRVNKSNKKNISINRQVCTNT
jgi:hypothetical protein